MRNDRERRNTDSLPTYLVELLRPTPSGVAKLLSAWDGLSAEVKIQLLMEIPKLQLPEYLHEKVCTKALESENPYIRYLAARQFYFSTEESDERKAIKKRIEEDSDDLVRYSLLEKRMGSYIQELDDPEAFFRLPQAARLAKVRCLTGLGERIANVMSYAVDHQLKDGKVSEIELFEILSDYINKGEFSENYRSDELSYDGLGEYLKGKDIAALWHLALKVPESISYVLIANLPERAGLQTDIPEDVINSLNDRQLAELLYREDIGLKELRKKVFFEASEERRDVKNAAISCNFNLTYEEFAQVLAKPEKEKVDELLGLTNAYDLSLCLYEAIHDALFMSEGLFDWQYGEYAKQAFNRKLSELQDYERQKELRELRLYRLAQESVPWKKSEKGYAPSGKLELLAKFIVEGDTWGTFMAFSAAWEKQIGSELLEKYLPRIYEINEWMTDQTDADEHQKSNYNKPLTKGEFILHNIENWLGIWSSAGAVLLVIALGFMGSAVYEFFKGEYGPAIKSLFVVAVGLVMFKGALGRYSQLRKEQRRIMDEISGL